MIERILKTVADYVQLTFAVSFLAVVWLFAISGAKRFPYYALCGCAALLIGYFVGYARWPLRDRRAENIRRRLESIAVHRELCKVGHLVKTRQILLEASPLGSDQRESALQEVEIQIEKWLSDDLKLREKEREMVEELRKLRRERALDAVSFVLSRITTAHLLAYLFVFRKSGSIPAGKEKTI